MGSARRVRIALALILPLLCSSTFFISSCTQLEFQGLGYDYLSETFMESLPQDSTRGYWLKLYRIMEVVNDTLAKRMQYMDVTEDSATIDSLVEEFKRRKDFATRPDTPERNEWWEEIWNIRAAHCDSFYHSPFMKDWWDMRARPVLIYGIPPSEFWTPCPGMTICSLYYMDWPNWALYLIFNSERGDGVVNSLDTSEELNFATLSRKKYCETFVDHEERFDPYPRVKKRIEAAVDVVSFPEGDSYELWLTSGVGIDQYVPDHANSTRFHQTLTVSRLGEKPQPACSDSTIIQTLPMPDSGKRIDEYWLPLSLGGCRLSSGEYDIYLTLYDDNAPNHVGAYRTTVTLPSPRASKGISEILVAVEPAGRVFEGTANRIVRGDRTLLGNPAYYHRGDTINPYLEIDLSEFKQSKSGTYDYTIIASLYRSKESFGKPTTTIGDVFEVTYDTLDDAPSKTLLRKPQRKGEGMIYSITRSSKSPRVFFQEPMVLPPRMSAGKYILVISAQDASSRKYLTSWREIRVKK
jgi:hypothetical protein